jgi:hypothetical protein
MKILPVRFLCSGLSFVMMWPAPGIITPAFAVEKPEPSIECKLSLWEAPKSHVSAQQTWDGDTANLVGYRSKGTDKLESQYVTGDILRISREEFPSEDRTVAESQSGVRSLTFDGREIVIDMPLVFTSASVRFLAETVRFTQRGSITFSGEPRDGGDGITIIANSIDTSNALHRPFQFVTQDARWSSSAKRVVTITAPGLRPAHDPRSVKKWIRSLTLDEDYAEPPKGADPYQSYVVTTGASGQTAYMKSLDAEMLWPQQVADKIARQFAQAPFDEDRNTFLAEKATKYLQLLRNTHHALARSVLSSTKTAIDLHVDQLGFHHYFIPRTGFADLQKSFKELADKQLISMAAWDSAILAAHGGRQFDQNRFDELSGKLQAANNDIESASDRVTAELGHLSQHEQDIAVVLQKIEQQRIIIQARRNDAAEKEKTNQTIGTATNVLVMAAAFLPVSAPVAIGVGTALSMTGKGVLAHNQGKTVTGLSVAQTLPSAIAEAKAFNTLATSVKANWDKVRSTVKSLKEKQDALPSAVGDDAKGKATTARNDAAEKAANALGEFGNSASVLFDKVRPPEPTQLSLDSFERDDTVLQELLKQVGDIRNAEAETLARLDVARKDIILKTGRRDEVRTDVETARASTLQNDREISRLEELAWTIRQTFLRDLAYNVAVLLRAYKYHTSLDPEGPINATYFSTYYRLSRPSTFSKEDREGEQFFYGGTETELGNQLKTQDKQLRDEVEALETQIDQGYHKYFDRIAQHNFLTEDKVLGCSDEDTANEDTATRRDRCNFVKAVNLEITRQVISVASGHTDVRPTAIPIPISIQEAFTGLPEKLLDASILVKVEDPTALQGKSIQYSLVHPFIGALRVGDACYTVDMRRADAIENVQRFTSSCDEGDACTHTPVMLKEEYIKENAALAALPLDARYYLEVRVRDSSDAQQLPKLTEIKIHLSYVQ